MAGAFSYASFTRSATRAGGWGVGQRVGDITKEELQELTSYVPTSLNNGTSIPDFPSPQERAELVRRTAVFALSPEAEKWVTMVSVPAGIDATGRGGNVFTYTCVTRDGVPPAADRVLYSPDVPAPFSIFEVDKVQIPAEITRSGPLKADKLLDEFLDGQFSMMAQLPAPMRTVTPNPDATFNHALVEAMAQVLKARNGFVILVAPENQAALWVAATARLVGEEGFGFSTFEKAAAVNDFPRATSTMIVVPPSEKLRLNESPISGNPVIFALDEALPDVSAYVAPARAEQPEQEVAASQEAEPSEQAAPTDAEDPFSFSSAPRPSTAPVEEADSPFATSAELPGGFAPPVDAHNPFASRSSDSADAASSAGSADSAGSDRRGGSGDTAPLPPAGPQCNAVVPGLNQEEYAHLENFDPRWWLEHLDTRRGRAIQLACLAPESFKPGHHNLLMAAVLASWVCYFPRDYELLASDILRGIGMDDLLLMRNLAIDKYAPILNLQLAHREITGPAGQFLEDIARELSARSHGAQSGAQHGAQQGMPQRGGMPNHMNNNWNQPR
ncbi:hypothetical protein [Corynebacterium sp.]|uniref:GAP1-N2 domain-containing protein n=1 Tax=Corynebacterium sp. TaxID=1720 RepID=UPI0026DCB670|nr:hypothetical protein [Corynebacterium sp.]MDO5033093.1 hypothetical protein [Corynebacterium sp.]